MFKGERRRNSNGLGTVPVTGGDSRWYYRTRREMEQYKGAAYAGRGGAGRVYGPLSYDKPVGSAEQEGGASEVPRLGREDRRRATQGLGVSKASGWCRGTGRTAVSRSRADSLKELEALDSETHRRRRRRRRGGGGSSKAG
jgi:hypothetical protein